MENSAVEQLGDQLERLIHICDNLRKENYTLRQAHAHAVAERDKYQKKTQLVQARIEHLLVKLRAIEE